MERNKVWHIRAQKWLSHSMIKINTIDQELDAWVKVRVTHGSFLRADLNSSIKTGSSDFYIVEHQPLSAVHVYDALIWMAADIFDKE